MLTTHDRLLRRTPLQNLIVLQSGGPTSVLNASLVGIIRQARNRFGQVLGSARGFEGILNGNLIELSTLDDEFLERLGRTPSAGLGTSRLRPDDQQLDVIVDRLRHSGVTAVVGIGGNDTADTLLRLEERSRTLGAEIRVAGIPKTIDNDLAVTDHSLGYPSAARTIAAFTRDAIVDTAATSTLYPLKLIEVMGRNAGWLAASGTLWAPEELPPPVVLLPERPLKSEHEFMDLVQRSLDRDGLLTAVVPETMRWSDGSHVAGGEPEWVDAFGHPYFPSAGQALVRACGQRLGVRGKLDRPGSVSRSSIDYASTIDLEEAESAGRFAVSAVGDGDSGSCVVIKRIATNPYRYELGLTPLGAIANVESTIPREFLDGNGQPGPAFVEYAAPLVGHSTTNYAFLDRGGSR